MALPRDYRNRAILYTFPRPHPMHTNPRIPIGYRVRDVGGGMWVGVWKGLGSNYAPLSPFPYYTAGGKIDRYGGRGGIQGGPWKGINCHPISLPHGFLCPSTPRYKVYPGPYHSASIIGGDRGAALGLLINAPIPSPCPNRRYQQVGDTGGSLRDFYGYPAFDNE